MANGSGNMPGRKIGADGEIELSDNQQLFLEWLTGDRLEGETQDAFAKRIHVSPDTVRKWKKDRAFLRRWEDRIRETHGHPDTLSKQLAVLNEQALTGNTKAIELYWKLLDKISPDRVEVTSSRTVESLSTEELDALYEAQLTAERERRHLHSVQ